MTALRQIVPRPMTVGEFLAWPGDGSGRRYQLVDGEPRAMAPASPTHGIVQANAARLLGNHLIAAGTGCYVVTEPGIVPRLGAQRNLRVPDLAVTCIADDPAHRWLPDPILVVEVLSPSNEAETRENVWAFASLPSVREILLLHSTGIEAELLRRAPDASWPEQPRSIGATDALELDSIGFRCCLAELYAGTHLAAAGR
jgi:Uma2 family endonuclease